MSVALVVAAGFSLLLSIIFFALYRKQRSAVALFLFFMYVLLVLFSVILLFLQTGGFIAEQLVLFEWGILVIWFTLGLAPVLSKEPTKRARLVIFYTGVFIVSLLPFFILVGSDSRLAEIVRGVVTVPFVVTAVFHPVSLYLRKGQRSMIFYAAGAQVIILSTLIALTRDTRLYFEILFGGMLLLHGTVALFAIFRGITKKDFDLFGEVKKRATSIKRRLFTLIGILAAIFLVMFAAVFFVVIRDVAELNTEELQAENALQLQSVVDQSFRDSLRLTREHLSEGRLGENSREEGVRIYVEQNTVIDSAVVSRMDGGIISRFGQFNTDLNEIEFTKQIEGFDVSDLFFGVNGEMFVYAQDFIDGERLVTFKFVKDLNTYVNLFNVGTDPSFWFLVNPSGDMLKAQVGAKDVPDAQGVCSRLLAECSTDSCSITKKTALPLYVDEAGNEFVGGMSYSQFSNVCAVSQTSQSNIILTPSAGTISASMAIIFVIGVVFVVAAYFFTKSILDPISYLRNEVLRIQGGGVFRKIETEINDEISQLGDAFNQLMENLQESRTDIERKVAEQTEELVAEKKKLEDTQKAMLNVLQDVNLDKERLAREKEKIEVIIGSIQDGFIFVDDQNEIILFNEAAEKITGYKAESVLGKQYQDFLQVHDEASKESAEIDLHRLQNDPDNTLSKGALLLNAQNNFVPVRLSASAVAHGSDVLGFAVVFQDVTREREMEKMKSNFVSIVSHQLRTPLSAVKWLLEMMIGGDAGDISSEQEDYLKRAYESNERMINLVSELLKVSRLESGKIKPKPKHFNIDDVVQKVLQDHEISAKAHNVKLVYDKVTSQIPEIQADPTMIENVLENFVANAIDYSKPGGKNTVQVIAEIIDDELVVKVADEGMGIDKKDYDKVFGMFYRGDNATKTRTDGSGLGLYIARLMIELSGGKIWFESEFEKGSTFYFSLPIK